MSGYTTTPNLGLRKPTVGGDGDAWGGHLNQNADLLDASVATTAFVVAAVTPIQRLPIVFSFAGKPSSASVVNVPMAVPVTVPAALAGTVVYDTTKTTVNTVFTLNKITPANVITALGTVTVTSASNVSATLAGAGGSLAVGDTLQIVAPVAQDATLADISITILGTRA